MQVAVIVGSHYLTGSGKQHRAFFVVVQATTVLHQATVGVFQQHGVHVVQSLGMFYRGHFIAVYNAYQRMRRLDTKQITVLLNRVNPCYFSHHYAI